MRGRVITGFRDGLPVYEDEDRLVVPQGPIQPQRGRILVSWDGKNEPVYGIAGGADGIYYRDTRPPFIVATQGNITLTTTNKALWSPTLTVLPANYWQVGKMLKLTSFIKMSSGTAGNYTYSAALGTGDNPSVIVQSAARAYVASVGPFSIMIQSYAVCRAIGASATVSMWGMAYTDLALQLSTNQPNTFPQNGTSVVGTFDSSLGTLALTHQMIASAGTHTANCEGLVLEALN